MLIPEWLSLPAGSPQPPKTQGELPPLAASRPSAHLRNTSSPVPQKDSMPPFFPPLSPPSSSSTSNPRGRLSILGFDSGQQRSLGRLDTPTSQGLQTPLQDPPPPNFRIGHLETDYDSELVTGMDVVEYYAMYGHSANIKLFHLNRDHDMDNPSPYALRVSLPPLSSMSK
jgi:hypothetical protein